VQTTHAECGAVLLFDTTDFKTPPVITISTGCPIAEPLSQLDRKAVVSRESQFVADFSVDDIPPAHEGVRSAIIVPVIDRGKTVGLIHVHSTKPNFFDQASLEVVQTLASHMATALENIQRNQEQLQRTELLRRRSETLAKITEVRYGL